MAPRGESTGRGRGSARPTSGRRADGRRSDRRRDGRGNDARSGTTRTNDRRGDDTRAPSAPTRSDTAGFDPDELAAVGVDDTRSSNRVGGLSPKRAVVLALVLSVVALTLAVPLRTYFSQRSEFDQLRSTHSALQQQVSGLATKVDEQSDPATIIAQARDRLQFVMPGDKALVMQFPAPPAKSDEQKRAEKQAQNPWYTNLLDSVSTPATK